MLPKEYRLKEKDDFQRAYQKGRFFSLGGVTINFCDNNTNKSRFGFVVGKNYSKSAVTRNRTRRILRASIGSMLEHIVTGNDFVIGIRKTDSQEKISLERISELLETSFKKNGLIKK